MVVTMGNHGTEPGLQAIWRTFPMISQFPPGNGPTPWDGMGAHAFTERPMNVFTPYLPSNVESALGINALRPYLRLL
ncbi:hypothetical protein MTBUT4_30093 [Magnetospirillum sp. UT-4]|nr:hypothetical protein MTBUT4_30093 [Magnetospirillum sp. UT-4]